MKVVEAKEDLELTVMDVKRALQCYSKLCTLEFDSEDFNVALAIAEDAIKFENASKVHAKLETNLQKVTEATRVDGKISDEAMLKYQSDMEKLSEQIIIIPGGVKEIPDRILNKAKLTPMDLLLLKVKLK
tara:strand:+ start:579 stop:968 length:390 start_codon:yes stop_codon:yes gene_type:complete